MVGVSKVSVLKWMIEVVKYCEGGDLSSSCKFFGCMEYEFIMFECGVIYDMEFEKWVNKVWIFGFGLGVEILFKDFCKDIIIEMYNEAGQLVFLYKVYWCWVFEYQFLFDFDVNVNVVVI